MDMGGAAEIFQSQEIKKKKKKNTQININFTKLNILYFDYYNISISFVHWYILNWKYENCYTELCRVQNFCILASTMTLVLKFLIPIIALLIDPPFWTTKWSLLDLPTLPPPEYLWTLPKKKLCSKMCFISLRIRQKLEMWLFFFFFFCQIWNINIQLKDNSLWYFATRTPLFDIYDFH